MRLILIGYRGTGKSSTARELGEKLEWPWVDSDVEIERVAGLSIRQMFSQMGEAAFRDRESEQIKRLCERDPVVLAVGGGAVLRESNRQKLQAAGRIVWLRASPETIGRRVAADPTTGPRRPNLTNAGGLNEILEVLKDRIPIYQACADLEVDTDLRTPSEVADEIIDRLNLQIDPPHSA